MCLVGLKILVILFSEMHENIDSKTFSIGKRDQDVGIQSANFNMEKKMLMH